MLNPEMLDAWMWRDLPRLERGQRPPDRAHWSERALARAVYWALGILAVAAIGYWFWWALWAHNPSKGGMPPDRWLNVMLGLGAVAAVGGVIGGGYLAARYGRRASVSIRAEARPNPTGVLIVARPSVKSVGIFRVRFDEEEGAAVTATEIWIDDDGKVRAEIGEDTAGRTGSSSGIFSNDMFVEGSEELQTTVLILMPPPTARVIGWMVNLEVYARRRFRAHFLRGRPYWWTDRVFVERPAAPPGS